jgi:mRNA interferase RelE/StbE
MDEYSIVFARSARKELEGLPRLIKTRILNRIERLSTNPRPANVRKLVGSEYLWRLRIGDYRVVYPELGKSVVVD